MPQPQIHIPLKQIEDFCRRWEIAAFSLFGSILRDDFIPDRNLDMLVNFEPDGGITFDNRVEMLDELAAIFGREVDLVEKGNIRNPFCRHEILTTREIVYAA